MDAKRIKLDSKFQFKERARRHHKGGYDDDQISHLPDEILVLILSSLPLKEAARTSVLSPRWIDLWKYTSRLNFDANSLLVKLGQLYSKSLSRRERDQLCENERLKYKKWVNCVLRSHKALTLKEFRICFDLNMSSRIHITKCLEFAFARHVQKLEVDLLKCCEPTSWQSSINYVFPENRFLTRNNIGFMSLKVLTFVYVDVCNETIEFFLRNCPILEQLVVQATDKLTSLEVSGLSLMLKTLEICYCKNLKSLKVSAPNLTSLTVTMLEGLVLENVPKLVELSMTCNCGDDGGSVENLLDALSCCGSQLEILRLQFGKLKTTELLEKFPELPKLKKLVVEYNTPDDGFLALVYLIMASPYLQKFVLKLICNGKFSRSFGRVMINDIRRCPHHHHGGHLKLVKFRGYYDCTTNTLMSYILEKCSIVLEKIIINPRHPIYSRAPLDLDDLGKEQTARDYAKKKLQRAVPQHIEFIVM